MNVARTLLIFGALVCSLPAQAADMTKTLRVAFAAAENGFDPQAIYDVYSDAVCSVIFDPLYTHDYFARPVQMAPNTAESLPQITDGGRTYTIKVKRGIYFATDPAFTGKKRELTAEDYEQAHALSDGGERNALFRKMTDLIVGYAPWIMSTYPYYNVVAQPWLKGFKFNPFKTHQWQYYDVDASARP